MSEPIITCPACGREGVTEGHCPKCGWAACEEDDHTWTRIAADPDVGIEDGLECEDCGLQIGDDGRLDHDWDDNAI